MGHFMHVSSVMADLMRALEEFIKETRWIGGGREILEVVLWEELIVFPASPL